MVKNYPTLKNLVPLFFLLFSIAVFSQTAGDFRSKATGSWTATSSWQTYNGIIWVDATSYPGQNAGTGAVLIQFGHTITLSATITTQEFGELTISGRLVLDGDNNGINFTLNTPKIYVTPSPNGGFIEFIDKVNLKLPEYASLSVTTGGLDDSPPCNATQVIYIGPTIYSKCNGGGQLPDFTEIMSFGGTLNANPTSNSPVCIGNSINLFGDYIGVVGKTTSEGNTDGVNYAWEITYPDNSIYSSTNKDFSILATKIGSYSAKLTCTTYFGVALFTNSKTISVSVNTNTWNGSVDTDWNTPGNWCTGVPTIGFPNTLDVVIPAALTNYPIIAADGASGVVNNIEIQLGASVTIEGVTNILTGTGTGNVLTIKGDLILNGKIDFEGESQLLQDTGSSLVGTGTIEIDQQGTGNSFRYNYWSSPVNSNLTRDKFTIDEVLKNGTNPITPITYGAAYTFAEQNIDSSPIQLSTYWMYVLRNSNLGYAAWNRVGNTGEVSVGEGYTMKGSNTTAALQNYTFVGKPNNGNINLTVDKGYDYLVGNPYPSALDSKQFLLDNAPPPVSLESPIGTPGKITGTIYFWEHYGGDTHNLAGYQGGYATRNLLDGTAASSGIPAGVSNLGSSVKGKPGRYIAVGQAFFVVGDSINGQIHFNNGQRAFEKEGVTSIFMKTSNKKAKTENTHGADLRPKFRIGFDAPKISHRQLLIGIDESATNGVDWGFDAEIYEVFPDDMYWILEGKKYVIQGTNEVGLNSEIPLGIQLSKTGVVTVKIDALENVDDDTSIYLKDKVTGESFNLRKKPVELNLTAGKYADRFVIVFKTQKLVTEDVVAEVLIPAAAQPIIEGIHVFMNNAISELQIKNNSSEEILSVSLTNTVGQRVNFWNTNLNQRTISLPLSTATGVYLVQINTKTGKTVKKISVE
ncbi:MAG TPA: T9SS type A sorting domain-containing protein [Lutibacter sp.]